MCEYQIETILLYWKPLIIQFLDKNILEQCWVQEHYNVVGKFTVWLPRKLGIPRFSFASWLVNKSDICGYYRINFKLNICCNWARRSLGSFRVVPWLGIVLNFTNQTICISLQYVSAIYASNNANLFAKWSWWQFSTSYSIYSLNFWLSNDFFVFATEVTFNEWTP